MKTVSLKKVKDLKFNILLFWTEEMENQKSSSREKESNINFMTKVKVKFQFD